MADPIEIEELALASQADVGHSFPVQLDGETQRLTIQQLIDLLNLDDIAGTIPNDGLPARLKELAPSVDNANSANVSGWAYLASGATNSPDNSKAFFLHTIYGTSTAAAVQTAVATDNSTTWRRIRASSTWGAWAQTLSKQSELDARYQAIGGGLTYSDFLSLMIESPANGTYALVLNLPFEMTIKKCTAISVSGTCTVRPVIDSTPVGSAANSVSTSESVVTHTTANVAAVGSDLKLAVASVSSADKVTVTIEYERALELG